MHLFEFTSGHPFYLSCLTTAKRRLDQDETGAEILYGAIYNEIKEGRDHIWCQRRVEMALVKARRQATLGSVL